MFKAMQNHRANTKLLETAKHLDTVLMAPRSPEDISAYGQTCSALVRAFKSMAEISQGSGWQSGRVFALGREVIRNPFLPYSDEQAVLQTLDTLKLSRKDAKFLSGYRAYQDQQAKDPEAVDKLRRDGADTDYWNWGIRIINRYGYCGFAEARQNLSKVGAERPGPLGTLICSVVLDTMNDAREAAGFIYHCSDSFLERLAQDQGVLHTGKVGLMFAQSPQHADLSAAWAALTVRHGATSSPSYEQKLQPILKLRADRPEALRAT